MAPGVAQRGNHRRGGRLLFLNLYLLGALVTIFLSLDVTAVMIAPVVCALVRRARLAPLPFVLACGYVANTASLFLPVSNLTNMLVYSLLRIPFWSFVRLLVLPNLAAMAVNLVVFFVLFQDQIPARLDPTSLVLKHPSAAFKDSPRLLVTTIGVGLVVLGLVVFGAVGLPLYLPAVAGALVMSAVSIARNDVRAERIARDHSRSAGGSSLRYSRAREPLPQRRRAYHAPDASRHDNHALAAGAVGPRGYVFRALNSIFSSV